MSLKAPFPYFGGKSKVAGEVWKRFGDVNNYIEPFCGSMALLLHKDEPTKYELVNDIDGLLTNFWRAIKFDPEGVADLAEVPSTEIDMMARHNWVAARKDNITKMQEDPSFYDVEAAAYWVYVRSSMIGQRSIFDTDIGMRVPRLSSPAGIHAGSRRGELVSVFHALSNRLRKVTICCGQWNRLLTNDPIKNAAVPAAIFLDPPYQAGEFDVGVYEHCNDVFTEVRDWCIKNGNDPDLRIALCGYGGNEMPENWVEYSWSTAGGMGRLSDEGRGRDNASRERIWFSPHCVDPDAVVEDLDFSEMF